jgi:hypothetical protein
MSNKEGSVESEGEEDDEILEKYGFIQKVELELSLPTDEKEYLPDYPMKFLDKNYQLKQLQESSRAPTSLPPDPKPDSLSHLLTPDDYESNLSDVIGFLKKCGFPLENCFISFFSPIFSAYINCGLDPLPPSIKISKDDLIATRINNNNDEKYRLQLKFQWGIRSDTTRGGGEEEEEEETVNNNEEGSSMQQQHPKR